MLCCASVEISKTETDRRHVHPGIYCERMANNGVGSAILFSAQPKVQGRQWGSEGNESEPLARLRSRSPENRSPLTVESIVLVRIAI